MRRRYVLAPEAARDLVEIWRYIKRESTVKVADRIEVAIRDQIVSLARNPGIGHWRKDLTDEAVKFFPVYSYLIVYRPDTKPLQIVAILQSTALALASRAPTPLRMTAYIWFPGGWSILYWLILSLRHFCRRIPIHKKSRWTLTGILRMF